MVQKDAATTYKEENPNAPRGYWNSSEKKWGSIWMNHTSNKNKKQANKTNSYLPIKKQVLRYTHERQLELLDHGKKNAKQDG